jgi:hypothetical protein
MFCTNETRRKTLAQWNVKGGGPGSLERHAVHPKTTKKAKRIVAFVMTVSGSRAAAIRQSKSKVKCSLLP